MHPLIAPEALLADGEFYRVLDCRAVLGDPQAAREGFHQAHIPGAIHVDLEQVLSGQAHSDAQGRHPLPDPQDWVQWLAMHGIGRETPVVCYDTAGGMMAAARAWWMLLQAGVESVQVLDGGLQAWEESGGILDNGPSDLILELNPDECCEMPNGWAVPGLVTARELAAYLDDVTLVDARNEARFAGLEEPQDAVAGHIPGAVCRPCSENLSADGRFLPAEQLHERFRALYEAAGDQLPIFYCGSGVTACHNLLAARAAGWPLGRLYAGSWSDWISDTARPVNTDCHK
ncbi:hypothetical protein BFW38_05020 [Terasakiispira papahanaumokuakeensis]|uniref:Rhodanese domain-containing protein n=1 Tax=Terasakiispira papahanaumokuakeensis TaxID=197479 RepID=A0A1E2V7W2_9GAMM|nr:sulfurtransferase [Terasakiispira papahanaumokuakeensis]ODC03003.1 hypothetical protein BFW38_05020 [Terasakiispira papahanaumokuakeensis]